MWPTTTATYQVIASLHKSWNIWMINNDNIWSLDLLGVFSLRLQFFPAPHSWHCQAITYASKELLHEEEAPLKPWGVRTQDNSLVICPCLKIIDLGPRTIQDSRMYFVDSVYKGFYSGGTKAHLFGKMNDSPVQVSNILELLAATHMWKTILDCENSANRRLFFDVCSTLARLGYAVMPFYYFLLLSFQVQDIPRLDSARWWLLLSVHPSWHCNPSQRHVANDIWQGLCPFRTFLGIATGAFRCLMKAYEPYEIQTFKCSKIFRLGISMHVQHSSAI